MRHDDKKRFGILRAGLRKVASFFKRDRTALEAKRRGYSGCKSRPHVQREPRYLHVSRPLIPTVDENGETVYNFAARGQTYRRPELRRHELRRLKKAGVDLSGQENTRMLESLLQ